MGCFVLQGIFQHLGYFLALASQPCSIWTVSRGLRSVLEVPFDGSMSPAFLEGVPKWSGELTIFFARAGLLDPPIFSAVSALVAGLLFS